MKERDLHPAVGTAANISPGILRTAPQPGRSAAKPVWIWIIILVLALLYAASPIDFIPDLLPVLGWIDDVVVVFSAILLALPKIIKR